MNSSKVVKSDPEIQGGTPCFVGTRVPVEILFEYLGTGESLEYFLEQFPSVSRAQAETLLMEAKQWASTVENQSA